MPSKIVAIHQPNFFPWLGYFDKIARADVFILLDHVQFQKTGGTWCNRVRLIVNKQADWVTVPVVRNYHGTKEIREVEINNTMPWREKLVRTIEVNYKKAPYFEEIFPVIRELICTPTNSLAEYNITTIRALLLHLGLHSTNVIIGSSLQAEGHATDLLISLVKAVGGTAYLCGGGANGYQEDEKFAAAGVELRYQNFQHPMYSQGNTQEFIPGLSTIDVLMNCGFQGTHCNFLQKT